MVVPDSLIRLVLLVAVRAFEAGIGQLDLALRRDPHDANRFGKAFRGTRSSGRIDSVRAVASDTDARSHSRRLETAGNRRYHHPDQLTLD